MAGASPSAPHTSTCTAAVSPFRSTLCRKSPKMCSMSLSPAWTRASRWVRITLLPRHKDGTVLFLHLFVKKNSHRIKMANLLVSPAKYHSAALASSPPVNISSYSLSRTRACLLTSWSSVGQSIAYNCQSPNNADQDVNSVATGQPQGGSNNVSNGAQHWE